MHRGGVYVNNEHVGDIPQSGIFTYKSTLEILDNIYISGGLPSSYISSRKPDGSTIEETLMNAGDFKIMADASPLIVACGASFNMIHLSPEKAVIRTEYFDKYNVKKKVFLSPQTRKNVTPGKILINYTEKTEYSTERVKTISNTAEENINVCSFAVRLQTSPSISQISETSYTQYCYGSKNFTIRKYMGQNNAWVDFNYTRSIISYNNFLMKEYRHEMNGTLRVNFDFKEGC